MTEEELVYERVMDYQHTFALGRGVNVLRDLRAQYMQRSSFVPGDPHATAFREGQRDVVLAIESMLRTAEDPSFSPVSVSEFLNNEGDE